MAELEKESFDAILLDAPCSAEGRIKLGDERSYGFWSLKNIREKAVIQKELLEASIPLLKK
jgi:16S rRNA (cytosine1407-C5)-methyltransferase